MQLDKTRIVIRERSWLDILDLALHVLRAYPALVLALAAGAVPCALLNHWLLRSILAETDFSELSQQRFISCATYVSYQWLLTMIELPTATAFMTLYLGQALFMDKPKPRELLGQFLGCLPQLLWFQVIIRTLLGMFFVTWLVPYVAWPYLNEVILLERNPWRGRPGREISTYRRSSTLHSSNGGDFFLYWIGAVFLGVLLTLALWLSLWFLRGMLGGAWSMDRVMFTVALPAAEWLVVGYFAVVRYLGYLDLRIRREGWEVELRLRAERTRLMPQVA